MIETGKSAEDAKRAEVYRAAYDLFCRKPDWMTFFREIVGLGGLVRRIYPTPDALADFEQSDTFNDIQQFLTRLREIKLEDHKVQEPTKVITVRLPKSLHESLRTEAHERQTSMNKLCISKLLQFIDNELVPTEIGGAAGEPAERE